MSGGNHRKSPNQRFPRKGRLPIVDMMPDLPPVTFEIGPGDWARIQAAYGIAFSDDDKTAISEFVAHYLKFQRCESSTKTYKQTIDQLKVFHRKLQQTTQSLETINSEESGLELISQFAALGYTVTLPGLRKLLRDLGRASERAVLELARPEAQDGGFEQGGVWRLLIIRLLDFAKERGLRTTISKAKSNEEVHSPFVEFVRALQECFPEEYRWHGQSKPALAHALSQIQSQWVRAGE